MGPLGSSPNDLALMMKVLTEKSSHENNPKRDAYTQNFPFDIQLYQSISQAKGLRIGYFESMGLIETTPASKRAVHEVLDVIRALGHEPVRIQIPNEK
jgi:Asp-tRNA(Asn)/Glu-tRNA(Gln) amidotransferase A subunit family amidase